MPRVLSLTRPVPVVAMVCGVLKVPREDPAVAVIAAAVAAGVICEMRVPLPLTVAIKMSPVLPTAKATRSAAE
ncbi:unannotated protein [freshwater metagenome]|uniref:Unannotated protein n=1 Tax=freshwater metagenome TaxID=449393 RepID=A0A6J7LH08_9ZZZZ